MNFKGGHSLLTIEAQMDEMNKTLGIIDYKCWYYKTALEAGTENVHKAKNAEDRAQQQVHSMQDK